MAATTLLHGPSAFHSTSLYFYYLYISLLDASSAVVVQVVHMLSMNTEVSFVRSSGHGGWDVFRMELE